MRTPVFELHILPMIRAIDREHMLFAFDLSDYESLKEHSEQFADRVSVDMPPVHAGGPWPDEWVQIFRRWMLTGFKRLELGNAEYQFNQSSSFSAITVTGTYPAAGYRGWLEIESQTFEAKNYTFYFEAPDTPESGQPEQFNFRERFRNTDTRAIFVKDASGIKQLR